MLVVLTWKYYIIKSMKIVLQNVLEANVKINGELYNKINRGFLLLVGFKEGDDLEIVNKVAKKITKLRVFMDENGKTNLSLKDINGEILSISQFTLYGDISKGNRPSFIKSLDFIKAKELYEYFNKYMESEGFLVKTGIFGEDMKVSLVNDGPFTLIIDSEDLKWK